MARAIYRVSLALVMFLSGSCSLREQSKVHERPKLDANSYLLKVVLTDVEADRDQKKVRLDVRKKEVELDRKMIECIARSYANTPGKKTSIDRILQLNADCRPGESEKLILGRYISAPDGNEPPCKTGRLLVPIDEKSASDNTAVLQ